MEDFSIHAFLLDTTKGLIGHRPDYVIREMTAGWYDKGVFTADDVAEIAALLPPVPVAETQTGGGETC